MTHDDFAEEGRDGSTYDPGWDLNLHDSEVGNSTLACSSFVSDLHVQMQQLVGCSVNVWDVCLSYLL